jgi:hypothetical protein
MIINKVMPIDQTLSEIRYAYYNRDEQKPENKYGLTEFIIKLSDVNNLDPNEKFNVDDPIVSIADRFKNVF